MIQYLFIAIGFPPIGSGSYICTHKARTVIYLGINNTVHITQNRKQDIKQPKKKKKKKSKNKKRFLKNKIKKKKSKKKKN